MRLRWAWLALLLIARPGFAASEWHPGLAQGLTNDVASVGIVTNLLKALVERQEALYRGSTVVTGAQGAALFRWYSTGGDGRAWPMQYSNTVTHYDYSATGLIFCGATTNFVGTNQYVNTNWCPTESVVVYTNLVSGGQVSRVVDEALVGQLLADTIAVIPGYVRDDLADTNGTFDPILSVPTIEHGVTSYPYQVTMWTAPDLFEREHVGRVLTNISGAVTSRVAVFTKQPARGTRVELATAMPLPWRLRAVDVTNATDLADVYDWTAPGVYRAGDRYIARSVWGWMASTGAPTAEASGLSGELVGPGEWGPWGTYADLWTGTGRVIRVAAVSNDSVALYFRDGDTYGVDDLVVSTTLFPRVYLTTTGQIGEVVVTIQGAALAWQPGGFSVLTSRQESVTLSSGASPRALTNQFADVTNVVVSGPLPSAVAAVSVRYDDNVGYMDDVAWQVYREPLVECYKILNALRWTTHPSRWIETAAVTSRLSKTGCLSLPNNWGCDDYTALAMTPGLAATSSISEQGHFGRWSGGGYEEWLDDGNTIIAFAAGLHAGVDAPQSRPAVVVTDRLPPPIVDYYLPDPPYTWPCTNQVPGNAARRSYLRFESSAQTVEEVDGLYHAGATERAITGPVRAPLSTVSALAASMLNFCPCEFVGVAVDVGLAADPYNACLDVEADETGYPKLWRSKTTFELRHGDEPSETMALPVIRWNFHHQD